MFFLLILNRVSKGYNPCQFFSKTKNHPMLIPIKTDSRRRCYLCKPEYKTYKQILKKQVHNPLTQMISTVNDIATEKKLKNLSIKQHEKSYKNSQSNGNLVYIICSCLSLGVCNTSTPLGKGNTLKFTMHRFKCPCARGLKQALIHLFVYKQCGEINFLNSQCRH